METSALSSRSSDSWSLDAAAALRDDLVKTRLPKGPAAETKRLSAGPPRKVLADEPTAGDAQEAPRYEVCEEVGRGGMGKVLRVKDTDLNRQVAMKVLITEEAADVHVRRFIEEAQITGQLEHPNVLPVHDFGVSPEGGLFFTMKLVRGHRTIEDVVEKLREGEPETHREFTFERRVQVIQQVCHALRYAHLRGVVHRDIKPQNIVLGSCGEVFLVDWGVAKLLDELGADPTSDRAPEGVKGLRRESGRAGKASEIHQTRDGDWLGTPAYMAPEQVVGRQAEVDPRTDLYSLCAVLYELLSLHYYLGPLDGKVGDLMGAILQRVPVDAEAHLDAKNGRVPRILSRICRKGLAKRREERFQSARELEQALQGWLEGNAPIVCPGTAIKRGLSKWGSLIDRYPVMLPAISITIAVLLATWIVFSAWLVLRGR
jgi:eukaryotic-like serine/threonine-protein kinase